MAHNYIERTLVIIKPDGVARGLVGEVISRFERVGLKLVDMKMVMTTLEHAENHYVLDDQWKVITGNKTIQSYRDKGLTPPSEDPVEITNALLKRLAKYMVEGPVIPMVWEGPHAVKIVRKLVGSTEPFSSDVGTIRGDYVLDSYQIALEEDRSVYNLVHAAGSVKEAEQEIHHWFA
ncbi:MAG: nucleoside-diphosphate kinase [Patescibacteria group bacterium]